jgi:hypothetical protein
MTSLLGNAAKGLPALLGVFWGVWLFTLGPRSLWELAVTLILGWALSKIGGAFLRRRPLVGWLLIECWMIVAISVAAFSTYWVLWFTVNVSNFIAFRSTEEQKALAAVLVGAVSTYLAGVFTKDIAEGKGFFSPAANLKRALDAAFGGTTKADTRRWDAIYEDRVREDGPKGWGFKARFLRVRIISSDPS